MINNHVTAPPKPEPRPLRTRCSRGVRSVPTGAGRRATAEQPRVSTRACSAAMTADALSQSCLRRGPSGGRCLTAWPLLPNCVAAADARQHRSLANRRGPPHTPSARRTAAFGNVVLFRILSLDPWKEWACRRLGNVKCPTHHHRQRRRTDILCRSRLDKPSGEPRLGRGSQCPRH